MHTSNQENQTMTCRPVARVCSKCSVAKELQEFHRNKSGKNGRHSWCKECANADKRAKRGSRDSAAMRRRQNLWTRYRITEKQKAAMIEAQQGRCAICGEDMKRACVDHCHATGAVRGILCHGCNIKLHALENKEFKAKALAYLANAGQQAAEDQT